MLLRQKTSPQAISAEGTPKYFSKLAWWRRDVYFLSSLANECGREEAAVPIRELGCTETMCCLWMSVCPLDQTRVGYLDCMQLGATTLSQNP